MGSKIKLQRFREMFKNLQQKKLQKFKNKKSKKKNHTNVAKFNN